MSYSKPGYAKKYAGGDSPYYRLVIECLNTLYAQYSKIDQQQLAAFVGGRQLGRYVTSSVPNAPLRRAMDIAEANGLVTKYREADRTSGGLRVWYKLHLEYGQKPLAPGEFPL